MTSEQIVIAFCEAWERSDLEAILGMLASDVDYQNVPAPAMIGREAVREFIAPLIAATTKIEFIMKAIGVSADGSTILTERIDKLHYGEQVVVLPLMGIFVVKDGLISQWRDYADSASVNEQFAQLSN
ncbi:MAG TPA: limonene-1,2-epoxide hydrolase family protein [Sphingobium sp.]|nr:limonene-1,2-epoxide hydrolase family protein [Sphingobium sp.]